MRVAPLLAICMTIAGCASTRSPTHEHFAAPQAPTQEDVLAVSAALARYTSDILVDDLWNRSQLSRRDRSIVTISVLISRHHLAELPAYLNHALDNGVTPGEISEIITHLAFYSGWANATGAVAAARTVFAQRGITPAQLPPAKPVLLPLDEAGETARKTSVDQNFGKVAPGVTQITTDVLFHDLWLRPGLVPRDRSLVTVSALVATGQVAQLAAHLNRAMDNGLTQAQGSEALTQLAFYAGWPAVFNALPIVKDVFEKGPAR
jgi:4-carboxymuconolactone decarboxylase